MPSTQSKTSGAPISSFQASIISIRLSGVNSEGLTTTAAPACRAGIESPSPITSGKFQGLIMPTTGWGRYRIRSFFEAISGEWGRTVFVADELRRVGRRRS